uniref:C2H2-type domain-containing protein n=1 Tax=Mesocestoides corti TaxID=53468 RepID=A0A5K3EIW1_MESCO
MSLTSPNFTGVAATFFSSNIHRLESATGCFVCLQCGASEWKGSWNPDHFIAHINNAHRTLESFSCIFCGLDWPRDCFVAHVSGHFAVGGVRPAQLYSCPALKHSSLCSFQTNSIQCLRLHLSSAHRGEEMLYKCVHCSKQDTTLESWISHVTAHAFRLSHCMADGCSVKSPSKQLMINHAKRKHGPNYVGLVRESVEFICSHNGIVPLFLRAFLFGSPTSAQPPSPPKTPPALPPVPLKSSTSLPTVGLRNGQPCTPLCLRCPKCQMATASWSRFHNHVTLCDEGAFAFNLYWCPRCSTVSTEKSLVEEHVQTAHDITVPVIHEKFEQASTTLEDSAACEKPSEAVAATVDILDPLVPPTTTPANVFSAFSNLLPPPPPPIQSDTSTTISPLVKTVISSPKSSGPDNPIFAGNPFLNPTNFTAVAAMAAALTGLAMNNPQPPLAPPVDDTNDDEVGETGTDTEAHSNGIDEAPNTPASSTNTADESTRTGRTGEEELVSFPFDETQFRKEMGTQLSSEVISQLAEKMHRFSSYVIKILGKENHRRVPQCPECDRVFSYGLPDFKRHLLAIHLGAPREHLKDLLRFVRFPKMEVALSDKQEQAAMRQMRPKEIEPGVRKIPLPYSITILRRLTEGLAENIRDYIATKMRTYSQMSAIYELKGGLKRYRCGHCSYSSPHALADVRKHILGSHCGISTKHFRFCLQASRLDHVDFCLLSDEKLSRLAQEFLTRRQAESAESEASSSGTSIKRPLSRTPSPEASTANSLGPDENGVSRFTTVIPGSKNPVKVRIRGPVPPGDNATSPPSNSLMSTPNLSNSALLELSDLPKIPGLEGANQILDLPLPYSESVLRQLLENAGALPHQIEEMCTKMQVYSSNTMTRICQGDRTLAFRCSCGRLFVTTRQPDSKMRAATLADSRRHVMGVHARIPHEYITICCQASRISRENGFQLYPDEMLHRLAMDRPIKLNSPDSLSTAHVHRSPSKSSISKLGSLPPLRPLADLSGENSEDEKPIINSRLSLPAAFHPLSDSASNGGGGGVDEIDESVDPEPIDTSAVLACLNEQSPKEIERIIDLPYSKTALQVLVRGYCPPSYFGILLNKMQVYTAYKVFVTRRRGRRFFCCSGCNSVSPHGMGDIRKHILGVHAKVPERYKAAAMHCSRLSREDNSLLADRSLLQLAKMKWKGTVIKPLAEISIAGGFNGPSIKTEDLSTATPISRHLRNSVNRVPEDTPMVVISATPFASGELFSCSACTTASTDCAAMRSHVAREHLGARAYECPQCSEIFNLSADLINHCTTAHLECTPVIPPLVLPPSYREVMSSVVVSHEDEPLSPTVAANKETVAMEDDEMGKLWDCLTNSNTDVSPFPSPPVASNGVVTSSPAVFPTPLPVGSEQNESKPASNGVGSSRRKPCKANLVQFKQPKTSVEGGAEEAIPQYYSSDNGEAVSITKRARLEGVVETVDF